MRSHKGASGVEFFHRCQTRKSSKRNRLFGEDWLRNIVRQEKKEEKQFEEVVRGLIQRVKENQEKIDQLARQKKQTQGFSYSRLLKGSTGKESSGLSLNKL